MSDTTTPDDGSAVLLDDLPTGQTYAEHVADLVKASLPGEVIDLEHDETDRVIVVDVDKTGPYFGQGWRAKGEPYLAEPAEGDEPVDPADD